MLCAFCISHQATQHKSETPRLPYRNALALLVALFTSFIGAGNSFTMSSFEITATFRFVTVFSPFLMAALLIAKLLIPMLVVVASHTAHLSASDSYSQFALFSVFTDAVAVCLLFLIQTTGSWRVSADWL